MHVKLALKERNACHCFKLQHKPHLSNIKKGTKCFVVFFYWVYGLRRKKREGSEQGRLEASIKNLKTNSLWRNVRLDSSEASLPHAVVIRASVNGTKP